LRDTHDGVRALVAEVPAMDLPTALAQRILPALVRPGDEAVERKSTCGRWCPASASSK
jgi:hypothetical protein